MKPDSPGLEMEVDSISDSESESNVSHVVIDIDKEPGCHGKEMTINVDRSANDDNAFVIDLDKDDDQKHDVKASAAPIGGAGACGTIPEVLKVKERVITVTNKSGLMGSKKPVKFKSERQKEIERQQRHMMSTVKSSHSATLTPLSTNHLPAVKLSSSFPEVGIGLPTQPHIIPDDDIDDVDGILDDVMSEKRLKESVEKMDVSKYSDRLMMSVRSTLQDMYYDLVNTEATKAVKRTFQLELDKIMWQHRQQLAELKHNANLTLAEMRASLECDKQKVVKDLRQKLEAEKIIAINDTKKKQWCAYCSKEANFYCCWNTSYCDYPCQQAAWPEHMSKCTQTRTGAPQGETSSGGISVAGAETKPELARHTNISHRQADELHKDHQMALSYTFGGTQNAAGGMNSAGPFASTLQPPTNLQNVQQPLQSVAQMPLQLRYPGTAPHFQQQYAPIAPGQMVGHGGMPGQSGGPMLYSAVLRQPPSHTAGHMAGMTMGQNPGQLMMAPGTNLHRGPMSYRPPQGY
ncbi:hypothetical protein LSAT2_031080 [Lamellibrachia satsuma]|nr:hypothetical protein LSAT2_031080 [Lamellibrachia satsuma]